MARLEYPTCLDVFVLTIINQLGFTYELLVFKRSKHNATKNRGMKLCLVFRSQIEKV